MAIEIKEFVGDGNIRSIHEADTTKKKTAKKKPAPKKAPAKKGGCRR